MKNTNADRIMQEVGKVILGKDECIRQVMTAILGRRPCTDRGYSGSR